MSLNTNLKIVDEVVGILQVSSPPTTLVLAQPKVSVMEITQQGELGPTGAQGATGPQGPPGDGNLDDYILDGGNF